VRRAIAVTAVAALFAAPAASAHEWSRPFSPRLVALGKVDIGATVERSVKLRNRSGEVVTLTGFGAFGYNAAFLVRPGTCTLGTKLAPRESCTFGISASPLTDGAISGTFCFESLIGDTDFQNVCGSIVGRAY
jgi:hypothetical protein